jgi:hypothetical protein
MTKPPTASFVLVLAVVLGPLAWAGPARAQQLAPCDAPSAEVVACIAGRLCTCRFGRGSAATGLADGFRWDCGILRPRCGGPLPATIDPYRGPLPEALAIERRSTNITTVTGDRNRTRVGDDGGHGP